VLIECGAFGRLQDWPPELSGRSLNFKFSNPLQDAVEKAKVAQATTNLGLIAGAKQADPNMPEVADMPVMIQDAIRGNGSPARWLLDLDQARQQAAAQQAAATQQGNIVGALEQAQGAADVVKTGSEAAANLQDVFMRPPTANGAVAVVQH
jgi:hypothetical protein